jgi:hypothetical protein
VALAIVALTDSTGRRDALALAARGSSLLTLGRATEALQTLRQAEALAPALPKIRTEVAQAEQAAREEARRASRITSARSPGSNAAGVAVAGTGASGSAKSKPGARAAAAEVVTYSNEAEAAHTN